VNFLEVLRHYGLPCQGWVSSPSFLVVRIRRTDIPLGMWGWRPLIGALVTPLEVGWDWLPPKSQVIFWDPFQSLLPLKVSSSNSSLTFKGINLGPLGSIPLSLLKPSWQFTTDDNYLFIGERHLGVLKL
jgi:hypothetical protein